MLLAGLSLLGCQNDLDNTNNKPEEPKVPELTAEDKAFNILNDCLNNHGEKHVSAVRGNTFTTQEATNAELFEIQTEYAKCFTDSFATELDGYAAMSFGSLAQNKQGAITDYPDFFYSIRSIDIMESMNIEFSGIWGDLYDTRVVLGVGDNGNGTYPNEAHYGSTLKTTTANGKLSSFRFVTTRINDREVPVWKDGLGE